MNRLRDLHRHGVSVWYDDVSRSLIESGKLARLIQDDGVRGLTSNPAIFEKAIGGSADYDAGIRRHARPGQSPAALFERLAVDDIRAACDAFRALYDESRGGDGFVSLEVSPALSRDAAGTVAEAERLWAAVDRPNLMIKVPGTVEGMSAFEDLTARGISVNVTLLFSLERYAATAEAFVKGLERRAAAGKDLARVASVASFFVSRVDSAVDASLDKLGTSEALALRGKAAIANAKLAYAHGKSVFGSPRFAALAAKGARPQRLLWASTGTKNPAYKDTLYVEELIGPDTVNTMPPATVDAYRDHGAARPSLEESVDEAVRVWDAIGRLVDLPATLERLEREGLAAFEKSFETLMGKLAAKRALLEAETAPVEQALSELEAARFSERLWAKDPSLWKKDKAHQDLIRRSLGWLDAPVAGAASVPAARAFADEVAADGVRHAVVLGMGGSSLCVEVLRAAFGSAPGRPRLHVLDSTHPGSILELERELELDRTLFLVASKSGSTVEPNSFFEHFWAAASREAGAKAGRRFCAITDPGTSLEKLARERGFRRVFLNPADVGGRFSALTLFGLVPAALAGVDVPALLSRARDAARAFSPATPARDNAALRLGAFMGAHARAGRDKLTLSLPPSLAALGLWIEQLVAESTGKEGRGVLPVADEALAAPSAYGRDRAFVRVSLKGRPEPEAEAALEALEQAGHPVHRLELDGPLDLGAHFLLWEIATAAAGFFLGVDPFDQPDVQAAKEKARELLSGPAKGAKPAKPAFRAGGLAATADAALVSALGADPGRDLPLRDALAAHLSRVGAGDYVAVLAFLAESDENRRLLEDVRRRLRALGPAPVCLSWGPRYLHSTGQLHKGGPRTGVFLVLWEGKPEKLPVPGQPFSFGELCLAQAQGDCAAMLAAGRRALGLELGGAADGLRAVLNALADAAAPAR